MSLAGYSPWGHKEWDMTEQLSMHASIAMTIKVQTSICSTKDLARSVQFSRSVMSNSLQPHGLQHSKPPFPSPTPGVYSDSCQMSWWCHPTISSSVDPFSPCLQSFPVLGSFQMSQFFISGPPKTDGSWCRVLTKHGPLEKGMANHYSILAWRTPWTVWKGEKIGHWEMNSMKRPSHFSLKLSRWWETSEK